jgi:hypothetical protein
VQVRRAGGVRRVDRVADRQPAKAVEHRDQLLAVLGEGLHRGGDGGQLVG